MKNNAGPELSDELYKRIKLVRRDLSGLVFHFTRGVFENQNGKKEYISASKILNKILAYEYLKGTSTWTEGENCVCFTESPIQEFASIFSLNQIAHTQNERPRYEPYGIAVNKEWLYRKGGRPVIYENRSMFNQFNENQRYRLVEFDPENNKDYSWEREWRIKTDKLQLDPKNTLVVVPKAKEAFELISNFGIKQQENNIYAGSVGSADVASTWPTIPYWMSVSLDIFGIYFENNH